MPANFDWHAEEDKSWEEPIYVSPESPRGRRRRRVWLLLLTAVIVLLAGFVVWRQLSDYLTDTAEATETDVLASHELVTTAVTAADRELLIGLLSGRDPDWTATQLSLLEQGLLFDRPSLNLAWQPATSPTPPISLTLASDLRSAELVVPQTYRLAGGDETVILQQTLLYRQGGSRWLLSPPDDSFWGETIVTAGRYISLTFPARDQDLGRRLAADIESLVGSACSTLLLSCPDDLHLAIELTTDPAVWLVEIGPEAAFQATRDLVLPAPTLAGRPADVAAYRAVYWAYGSRVLSALVSDLAGYSCCEHALFYQALVDKQLQQLGLRQWPLSADDYRQALMRQITLAELEPLWRENEPVDQSEPTEPDPTAGPDWRLAYAVVDFLFQDQDGGQPIIEMQRQLMAADTLREWTGQLASSTTPIDRAWLHYLQRQVVAGQSTPPVSWPDQDIALMCNDGTRGIANLYRLDPSSGRWSLEIGDRDFVVMMPLPNGRGLLLVEQYLTSDELLTTIWQDGQETALDQSEIFYVPAGRMDPTGRYLPLIAIRPSTTTFGLLDLTACQPQDCPILPLPGLPFWSPDGQHTLFEDEDLLLLGNGRGQFLQAIGPGQEPVWLGNDTFGYLSLEDAPELLVADLAAEGEPGAGLSVTFEVLFDQAALQAVLNEVITDKESLEEFRLTYALSSYRKPEQLVLLADRFPGKDRTVLIQLDYQPGELVPGTITDLLAEVPSDESESIMAGLFNLNFGPFSPDGRWLALSTEGPPTNSQIVFDTATGQLREFAASTLSGFMSVLGGGGWSADSQWLLRLVDGALIVTAPAENYQHVLTYPFANCTMAGWIASLDSDLAGQPPPEAEEPASLNN